MAIMEKLCPARLSIGHAIRRPISGVTSCHRYVEARENGIHSLLRRSETSQVYYPRLGNRNKSVQCSTVKKESMSVDAWRTVEMPK
jgi:hypothetical protein